MLRQYTITMRQSAPGTAVGQRSPLHAYHLYAALLERAPASFAAGLHDGERNPISQHLRTGTGGEYIWTVGLLGEEAEQAMSAALERGQEYQLRRAGTTLSVVRRECSRIADADELLELAASREDRQTLTFLTPTAFRSGGQYQVLPSERLITQSLMRQWNACVTECPIEDCGGGMEALAAGLRCVSLNIRDRLFHIKGGTVPGFVGAMTFENRLEGFQKQLLSALLVFSQYSGVGIKTTLGMGGVYAK